MISNSLNAEWHLEHAEYGIRGTHRSVFVPSKDYFPCTCSVPRTVLDSEDVKLN